MVYKNSVQRFREIIKIMTFHGFGFLVDSKLHHNKKSPENLRNAFIALGPTFIKIGQILSTRPDLLPAEYIDELSKLQDKVPKETFQDINSVFIKDFNQPVSQLFLEFDPEPIASASIAQVHRAVLHNNKEVIVKVQRPDIYEMMKMDLSILSRIANFTGARFFDSPIDPSDAIKELMHSTENELNFQNETANIKKFNNLNKKVSYIYTPYVVDEMCSKHIITMEKIDGLKITDTVMLNASGCNPSVLGNQLALSFFKQVFEDGYFHGDPHPGNILIRNNKLCFIDFGIMGSLPESLRAELNEMIVAIAFQDINKLISVLLSIGIKNGFLDRNQLYEDMDYLLATYLSTSVKNIKISLVLEEVMEISKRNNLKMPKELTLLARSMVIVEGVISKIAPDIKILDVAIPYVKSSAAKNQISDLNFEELLLKSLNFTRDSSKLPSKLIELSESIIRGRAKIQFEHKNMEAPVNALNKMINRLVAAMLISSLIIGSSLILHANYGDKMYGMPILGLIGYGTAGCFALWLLVSIMKSGKL